MKAELLFLCVALLALNGCALSHETSGESGMVVSPLAERFVGEWVLQTQWSRTLYNFTAEGELLPVAERGCIYCDSYRYSANTVIPPRDAGHTENACLFQNEWQSDDGERLLLAAECLECGWTAAMDWSCDKTPAQIELGFFADPSQNALQAETVVLDPPGWQTVAHWRKCLPNDAECEEVRLCEPGGNCHHFATESPQ